MPERILSGNTKLDKPVPGHPDVRILGVQLLPGIASGTEFCPWRGACYGGCIGLFAGRRVTDTVRAKARRLSKWLVADPTGFVDCLSHEIAVESARAAEDGVRLFIRPDAFSDLNWLSWKPVKREGFAFEPLGLVEQHPDVVFYGYTKSPEKMAAYVAGRFPDNYHLTYSFSEVTTPNFPHLFLQGGGNVSVVVDLPRKGRVPSSWCVDGTRWPTVDGDVHDLRIPEVDGRGRIVLLRLKGTNAAKNHARNGGFALPVLN